MKITLVTPNRNFTSSVEHEGELVRLRGGQPVELPDGVAQDVIEQAADYDLEVVEGEPEPTFDADVFTSAAAADKAAELGVDPSTVEGTGADGKIKVSDVEKAVNGS